MAWVQFAILLLQLANKIVDWRKRENLLSEGEQRAYAKQLAVNAQRVEITKAIDKKFETASDAEVLEELKNDFRRD